MSKTNTWIHYIQVNTITVHILLFNTFKQISHMFWSTMKIIMSTSHTALHLVVPPVNLYVPNDSLYWSHHVRDLLKGIKKYVNFDAVCSFMYDSWSRWWYKHHCKTWIYRVFLLSSHGAMQLTASARTSCNSWSAPVSNKGNTLHYVQHDRAAAGFVTLWHSAINDSV
jgi:hypothetical protein